MYRLARLFALFIFLAPLELQALALGDIELHSALNQPLDAQVELLSLGETELEDIDVRLASPEAFDRVGLERPFFLTDLRFALEEKDGTPYLLITSKQPFKEPFVDFLLEVAWPNGRLLREYTLLLDPPVFLEDTPAAVEAPVAAATTAVPGGGQRETAQRATPAAVAGAVATAAAGSLNYGPVTRSDTLWSIAKQLRSDASVTVPQVMMALLKHNPEAFYNNNVNELKAGYILRIPDPAAIAEIDPREAERQISLQNQQWQDARKQRAGQALKRPLGGGEALAAAAMTQKEGAGKPRLRLVVPDTQAGETALQGVSDKTAAGASSAAELDTLRRELALALESSEVGRQENAELRERLTTLEEQISSMQRLLTLRDDTMTALQSGAVSGADQTPDAASGAQEVLQQDSSAQSAAAAPVEDRQPQATPPAPRREPSQDFISQLLADPMLLGAAGGVALLILALAWVMVRRRRGEEGADFQEDYQEAVADESPAESAVAVPQDQRPVSTTEEIGETVQDSGDALGFDVFQPDEDEIDTLAEADVYLAYRRFDKAEELLKDAITQEPHRHDYVLKLLEVYVASENRDGFIAQAEALHAVVGEAGSEVWDKVVALGQQFLPEHPLFATDAGGEAAAEGGSEESEAEAGLDAQLAGLSLDDEAAAGDASAEKDDDFAALVEEEQFAAALPSEEISSDDMESAAAEEPAFGDFGVGEIEQKQQEEELDLDFDLGDLAELDEQQERDATDSPGGELTETPDSAFASDALAPSTADPQEELSTDQQEVAERTIHDDSLDEEGSADSTAEETLSPVQEFAQLEELAETVISRNDEALTGSAEAMADDSASLVAGDAGEEEARSGDDSPAAAAEADLESDIDWLANLDGEGLEVDVEAAEEGSDLISGEDEVSTKLDLARAYIDMGDQESARSILDEVLHEGNDDQKGEAEELIRQIG
ncbi:MAG: FimV/HubP family polar landmark protein [Gammaproteobacteria bacterium]